MADSPHMSTSNQEERRFALRMALRLPIVVSGRAEDGAAWSEPTETDDISTSGALFHLNQKVNRGERLYLRAHKPDGGPIEVTAQVIRVAPAIYGTARIGVQISSMQADSTRRRVSSISSSPAMTRPAKTASRRSSAWIAVRTASMVNAPSRTTSRRAWSSAWW